MTNQQRATQHTQQGRGAEENGKHELAAFHYEQAAFWRSLR